MGGLVQKGVQMNVQVALELSMHRVGWGVVNELYKWNILECWLNVCDATFLQVFAAPSCSEAASMRQLREGTGEHGVSMVCLGHSSAVGSVYHTPANSHPWLEVSK